MPAALEPPLPPPPGGGSLLRRLRERFGKLIHEIGKFGTVGGVAFACDLAIYNVLLGLHVETLTAKTISTLLAATVAFIGNRFWTWRHRERRGLAREYTQYFLLNAIGLAIGLACLAISHYGLGHFWPVMQTRLADNISGQLVGTTLGTLFRFWSYRRFVFRAPVATDPPPPVDRAVL
ncbi:MAG TPA: GtrA family protein [Actinoplanes sp.]|nr:GtrA family protein [Actinoplanes sp.]